MNGWRIPDDLVAGLTDLQAKPILPRVIVLHFQANLLPSIAKNSQFKKQMIASCMGLGILNSRPALPPSFGQASLHRSDVRRDGPLKGQSIRDLASIRLGALLSYMCIL